MPPFHVSLFEINIDMQLTNHEMLLKGMVTCLQVKYYEFNRKESE